MNINGEKHARFMMELASAVLHSVLPNGDLAFWVLRRADPQQAADSSHHSKLPDICSYTLLPLRPPAGAPCCGAQAAPAVLSGPAVHVQSRHASRMIS